MPERDWLEGLRYEGKFPDQPDQGEVERRATFVYEAARLQAIAVDAPIVPEPIRAISMNRIERSALLPSR